jgi:hypothetical protein
MVPVRTRSTGVALGALVIMGCGGGSPLLHPARTLPSGTVRVTAGASANFAGSDGATKIRVAQARASALGTADSSATRAADPAVAEGALASAGLAPGVAPFVGARVGLPAQFEGGLAYTGRSVRFDARHAFVRGDLALSVGLGMSALLTGKNDANGIAGVALDSLRGFGADVPVLVGWESDSGIYKAWGGVRGHFETATIEARVSEPKTVTLTPSPIPLELTRWGVGGLVGAAAGFR